MILNNDLKLKGIEMISKILKTYEINKNSYANADSFRIINESSIINMIFSKFLFDEVETDDTKKYTSYILQNTTKEFLEYEQNSGKIYIAENDYDVSYFASEPIKRYLMYFDIIKELYKYNIKNKEIPSSFVLDISYDIQDKKVIFAPSSIKIDIKYDSSGTMFSLSTSHEIQELHKDIFEHLKFCENSNIEFNQVMLQFYMMCKYYTMYMIIHSIYIVSNNIEIKEIYENILQPIYININDTINDIIPDLDNNKVVSDNINKTHSIKQNTNILKDKINNINNKISIYEKYYSKYDNKKTLSEVSYFILALIVLISISMYLFGVLQELRLLFSVMCFFIVSIIYLVSTYKYDNIENFENKSIMNILTDIRNKIKNNFETIIQIKNNKIFSNHLENIKKQNDFNIQKINIYSKKIDEDKNIKHVEKTQYKHDYHFVYQITLLLLIGMIYNNINNNYLYSIIFLLIGIIIIITIHNYYTLRIVRTSANNIYWSKPSNKNL